MQRTKSEVGGTTLSPESDQDGVVTGKVHPNAYHSDACMSSRQDGTRYCGWLLHGHPWCGTHGHQCEDLDPEEPEMKGRGS